jgi:hypothetical protein
VPLLLSLLGLALALTACGAQTADDGIARAQPGAGGPSASASPAEELSDDERRLKFAECMRAQGIEMEDPGKDKGGVRFRVGEKNKAGDMEKAMQACKAYAPNGGEPPKLDAEQLEQMRKFARCMRENGVPEFPDPGPDGRVEIKRKVGEGADEETFKQAQEKCRQFQPKLRQGEKK